MWEFVMLLYFVSWEHVSYPSEPVTIVGKANQIANIDDTDNKVRPFKKKKKVCNVIMLDLLRRRRKCAALQGSSCEFNLMLHTYLN